MPNEEDLSGALIVFPSGKRLYRNSGFFRQELAEYETHCVSIIEKCEALMARRASEGLPAPTGGPGKMLDLKWADLDVICRVKG